MMRRTKRLRRAASFLLAILALALGAAMVVSAMSEEPLPETPAVTNPENGEGMGRARRTRRIR